jgi:NADH-quinone oxidoreductase subunit C
METIYLPGSRWTERARDLREAGWRLSAFCGVDRLNLDGGEVRFEMVAQLMQPETKDLLTIHVGAEGDPPTIPSVTGIFPTVNFMEREAYDLYGIRFEGHPNLRRLLLPDEWEGHPLRKDYGVGKVPLQFLPQPFLQIDQPGQAPDAAEAGVEVDDLGQSGRAR